MILFELKYMYGDIFLISPQKHMLLVLSGSTLFLLKSTPFQKGAKTILKELPPLKLYPFS